MKQQWYAVVALGLCATWAPAASAAPAAVASSGLAWRDVSLKISRKRGQAPSTILDGVSGSVQPGRMLAIMGPSGSGKSSLLNALAGQLEASKGLALEGQLELNGDAVPEGRLGDVVPLAYVKQEDLFYEQMTVRACGVRSGE